MILLQEVVKEFAGPLARLRGGGVRALDGVTLEVPAGEALGVAGPNGAGKSTLLRLLLGYLRPSAGTVTVGGLGPREYVERNGVGYVPDQIAIPPSWSVREALGVFASLGEVPEQGRRVGEVLEMLGLNALAARPVGQLSKGNLQRVALAQALLGPRQVMILDEPSEGLDPEWTGHLRELIADWRAADPGRVLLVASHNLEEMERTVDRVLVLRDGAVCALLAARAEPVLRLALHGAEAGAVQAVIPGAQPLGDGGFAIPPGDPPAVSRGVASLLAGGAVLHGLREERTPLADRVRAALAVGR